MKRVSRYLALIVAAVAIAAAAWSCSKPCDELGYLICSCQPTNDTESACIALFINGNPVTITDKKESDCNALLKTCNCGKLNAGDWASCGLANKLPNFADAGVVDAGAH